jgi:general secretion pathway protein G
MKGPAMARSIPTGKQRRAEHTLGRTGSAPGEWQRRRRAGYTLIELIIVMAIISVLISVAVPIYTKSITRTKETLLKENLFTLRTTIDEYTFDKKEAPQQLEDLVREGYLRAVPVDPITGDSRSWKIIIEDALTAVDQTKPGIWDVRSGSSGKSLEGTAYSEW